MQKTDLLVEWESYLASQLVTPLNLKLNRFLFFVVNCARFFYSSQSIGGEGSCIIVSYMDFCIAI